MTAITEKSPDQSAKAYQANSLFRLTIRRIFRQRSAVIGGTILLFLVLVAIFAPVLAPFDPDFVLIGHEEGIKRRSDPCIHIFGCPEDQPQHILGTDGNVRDEFSRVIYGTRVSLFIGFTTVGFAIIIGTLLGALGGFLGGWVDNLLSRSVDVLMAIPSLIFALILLSMFGASALNLIIIIAVLDSTRVFRISRAVSLNVVVMDYVEAARLRGEGLSWIMRREILPNIMPPLVAEFGLRFCFVFLTIAALSFLGLGIQPPTADWGSMVRETAGLIQFAEYDITAALTPMLPAAAIALLTVAVNFVVDWFLHKSSGLKEGH